MKGKKQTRKSHRVCQRRKFYPFELHDDDDPAPVDPSIFVIPVKLLSLKLLCS